MVVWKTVLWRTEYDDQDPHQKEIHDIVMHPTVLNKAGGHIYPQWFQGPFPAQHRKGVDEPYPFCFFFFHAPGLGDGSEIINVTVR